MYVHPVDADHPHDIHGPDVPGRFLGVKHWKDLPRMVQEAVEAWCEGADIDLPEPSRFDQVCNPGTRLSLAALGR